MQNAVMAAKMLPWLQNFNLYEIDFSGVRWETPATTLR
jgi:hypothetical protein